MFFKIPICCIYDDILLPGHHRNHLLDQGYVLPNGETLGETLVQKKTLEAFHKDVNVGNFKPTNEFTPTWKLTDHHLSCYGSARQRVRLATELISNSVSKTLPLWDKEQKEFSDFLALWNEVQSAKSIYLILVHQLPFMLPYSKLYENPPTEQFIEVFVYLQWFDVMNSRTGHHKVHDLKSGYGLHLGRQEDTLKRAIKMAKNMRAILRRGPFAKTLAKPKKALIPFQVKCIKTQVFEFSMG